MESPNVLGWEDLNRIRNYPFTDDSTLVFTGGFLPQRLILDARIYIRGNYQEPLPAYISKIVKNDESVVLTISNGSGVVLGSTSLTSTSLLFDTVQCTVLAEDGIVAGCLIIDSNSLSSLYSFESGEYELDKTTATFVVSCCEYLPGEQVQSINGLSNKINITAYEGIEFTPGPSPNTITISVVGDPHFNRYGCPFDDDASVPQEILTSVFLEQLRVVHYVKNIQGNLVGPFVSKLTKKLDGSIVLALYTNPGAVALEARPAFRITTTDNTITFSLAGT